MKKLVKGICLLGVVALVATSCNKENTDAKVYRGVNFDERFEVEAANGFEGERVYLDDSYKVYFEADDLVMLFNIDDANAANSEAALYKVTTAGNTPEFAPYQAEETISDEMMSAKYAFYPGNNVDLTELANDNRGIFKLEPVQEYREGKISQEALYMAAKIDNADNDVFAFRNICGILTLKFYSPTAKTVKSIAITDNSMSLTGDVTLKVNTVDPAAMIGDFKNICEGNATVAEIATQYQPRDKESGRVDFSQDFFGRPANLTVSGQLEAETYACALGSVYTFGPTFRAENSNTTRHLAEFWMIEPEVAFADLHDDADLAEDYLRHLFRAVLKKCPEELQFFNDRIEKGLLDNLTRLADAEFTRITYTEAIKILEKAADKFEFKPSWGVDLQSEHERYLAEETFHGPVIVMDYPRDIKAFYMRLNDDQKTVAAMDVLLPNVGEIIGGSQREERLDVLERRIRETGMDPKNYWWYCDLRRFGSVPHAGFGLGFERMVRFCTGMGNIRDVIPYPRTPQSAEF